MTHAVFDFKAIRTGMKEKGLTSVLSPDPIAEQEQEVTVTSSRTGTEPPALPDNMPCIRTVHAIHPYTEGYLAHITFKPAEVAVAIQALRMWPPDTSRGPVHSSLNVAFDWARTEQGYAFWYDVSHQNGATADSNKKAWDILTDLHMSHRYYISQRSNP